MRNRLLVATVLAAGCLAGLGLRSGSPAAAEEPPKRPQWQYRVFYHSDLMALGADKINANLTKLGEEGWELVSVSGGGLTDGSRGGVTNQTVYFFKRSK
jgi:hypothetical protein